MSSVLISEDLKHRFSAVVWILMLSIGFLWGSYLLINAKFFKKQNQLTSWLNGSAGVELNKELQLPWQEKIQTTNAEIRYKFLGDLGRSVKLGCPHWMFYQDGLRPQPGVGREEFIKRLDLVSYWSNLLKKKGVNLLVVAVPDKARIQSSKLCGLEFSSVHQKRAEDWHHFLTEKNIPYVNLNDTLLSSKEDSFYRTDVHMNSHGTEIATQYIAEKALAFIEGKGSGSFIYSSKGRHLIEGDLINLSGLKSAHKHWRPAEEYDVTEDFQIQRAGGLLDASPSVEVALAGSSNGLRNHFADRLGMKIGREIWNLSMDGGQFSGAFVKFMEMQENWPSTLKLVIWEFSENTLSLPLTEKEITTLNQINLDK